MTEEPTNKYFGTSLSEWIERTPNELEQDAVSLWQIVVSGREGFELNDDALDNFVKRSIVALLERGALPVLHTGIRESFWNIQMQYGTQPDDIATSIIEEWHRSDADPDHDGLWFALVV